MTPEVPIWDADVAGCWLLSWRLRHFPFRSAGHHLLSDSRGSVRAAAATPPAPAPPGTGRPAAAASNSARAGPARPSASASSRAVARRAVRLMPRSRSLTDRGLSLAASASYSQRI